jgi:uncharacterized protein YndB with AHSA1/START domain
MTHDIDTLPRLTLERTIAAPRALVWSAWTDPAALARWWGPKGFVAPRCEFDARAGGLIHIDMLGPDGTVYPMTGRVEGVSPPERLSFLSGPLDASGERLFDVLSTLTLEESAGATHLKLDVRVVAIHDQAAKNHLPGMEQGWTESLERLIESCAYRKTELGAFTLERVIAAAPAEVFAAFSSAKAKAAWFSAPADQWSLIVRELDFRVGGRERLMGKWKSGTITDFDAVYQDIVPNSRIVYSYAMHLNAVRISVSLAVIEVTPHGDGTKLTVTEHGAFLDGYDDAGFRQRGTSDLLDALVRSLIVN